MTVTAKHSVALLMTVIIIIIIISTVYVNTVLAIVFQITTGNYVKFKTLDHGIHPSHENTL